MYWYNGRLLTLRYSIDPRFIKHLELDTRYKIKSYTEKEDDEEEEEEEEEEEMESNDMTPGLYVTQSRQIIVLEQRFFLNQLVLIIKFIEYYIVEIFELIWKF